MPCPAQPESILNGWLYRGRNYGEVHIPQRPDGVGIISSDPSGVYRGCKHQKKESLGSRRLDLE